MQIRTLSIFGGLALASAMAFAQSSTAAQSTSADQQVGIAGQPAPGNSAQPQSQRRHANPERQTKALARKLNLNRTQQSQIKPIIADRQQQIETLRADQSLTPRDRHARMQGVMQDSRTRIEALLTDSQKQQFEQLQADRRARRQQPGPPQAQ